MAEELETLVLKIRADTEGLAADTARMAGQFDADLAVMGRALDGLIRKGKLGLGEWAGLIRVLLKELAGINLPGMGGGSGGSFGNMGGGGFFAGLLQGALTLLSKGGRAAGGPVTEGRAYVVGERGPEIFIPERAGRVEPMGSAGARVVNISVNVAVPENASRQLMERSAAQVARAVRRALESSEAGQ